jgi:beta-glucosidase
MSLATWQARHEAFVGIPAETRQRAQLVFLGDSIIEGFDQAVWDEYFARYQPVRLGLGGDKTENVLWRIQRGELDGMAPRALVLLIGTNNLGVEGVTPADVARGVSAVIGAIQAKLPQTRILLLAILPREQAPDAELRRAVTITNAELAKLADARVSFLDLGPGLLAPDATISAEVMADFLHPTPKGYRILAEGLRPSVAALTTSAQ